MQKIKWASYKEGNILDWADKVDVIGHQVNCFGVMGGGLALQIATKWPNVEYEYQEYIIRHIHISRTDLLGHCHIAIPKSAGRCSIANLFGQYDVGGGLRTDYEALQKALRELKGTMRKYNQTKLALPVNLGCGLAGGNWNTVQDIIENVFENSQIELTLVSYIQNNYSKKVTL